MNITEIKKENDQIYKVGYTQISELTDEETIKAEYDLAMIKRNEIYEQIQLLHNKKNEIEKVLEVYDNYYEELGNEEPTSEEEPLEEEED